VVVHLQSTKDVSKVVKIAAKYKVPVAPYSGGTGLEGKFRAVRFRDGQYARDPRFVDELLSFDPCRALL
jgi:hypothetical protein